MKKNLFCTLTIAFLISSGFAKSDKSMQVYENSPKETNKELKKCLKNKTKNEFCKTIEDLKIKQDAKFYEENPKELDKKLKFCEKNKEKLSDFQKTECIGAKMGEYYVKVTFYRQNPKELEKALKKECPSTLIDTPILLGLESDECQTAYSAAKLNILDVKTREDVKNLIDFATITCKGYGSSYSLNPYPNVKMAVECTVAKEVLKEFSGK